MLTLRAFNGVLRARKFIGTHEGSLPFRRYFANGNAKLPESQEPSRKDQSTPNNSKDKNDTQQTLNELLDETMGNMEELRRLGTMATPSDPIDPGQIRKAWDPLPKSYYIYHWNEEYQKQGHPPLKRKWSVFPWFIGITLGIFFGNWLWKVLGNPGDHDSSEKYARLVRRLQSALDATTKNDEIDMRLPPPLDPKFQKKYTVVIDIRTLIHFVNPRDNVWLSKRRPGIDSALSALSQVAELVFVSNYPYHSISQQLEKLDPVHVVSFRLYRSSKDTPMDLSYLNRPLDKVLVITESKDNALQPENVLEIPKWAGADEDDHLLDISFFLEMELKKGTIADIKELSRRYKSVGSEITKRRKAAHAAKLKFIGRVYENIVREDVRASM